jgi:hypothetical protein
MTIVPVDAKGNIFCPSRAMNILGWSTQRFGHLSRSVTGGSADDLVRLEVRELLCIVGLHTLFD